MSSIDNFVVKILNCWYWMHNLTTNQIRLEAKLTKSVSYSRDMILGYRVASPHPRRQGRGSVNPENHIQQNVNFQFLRISSKLKTYYTYIATIILPICLCK